MQADSSEVHIWDWKQKKIIRTLKKPKYSGDPTVTDPIRYSPDGQLLAVCHSRGSAQNNTVIRIWNTATGEVLHDGPAFFGFSGVRVANDAVFEERKAV